MAPNLQRPEPVYMQLVAYYRDQIIGGDLRDGQRLPPVREIAEEWKVAHTTAAKALRQLASEGLVTTSNQGAMVTYTESNSFSPELRLASVRRGRVIYPHGSSRRISAELITAPEDIATKMGIEPGDQVIRRERVTLNGNAPVQWSVSWMPGEFAEPAPELLSLEALPKGTISLIKDRTGRFPALGKDYYRHCADHADALAAERLEVTEGSPVLIVENYWPDEQGMVEFGISVTPRGIWV